MGWGKNVATGEDVDAEIATVWINYEYENIKTIFYSMLLSKAVWDEMKWKSNIKHTKTARMECKSSHFAQIVSEQYITDLLCSKMHRKCIEFIWTVNYTKSYT